MNAFFASVEQYDRPELRGCPVGVTNGIKGTCLITNSYEARAFGIKTGMRLREALGLCPEFVRVASRPVRYAEVSARIMRALTSLTPDVEVFSVDEAFLDVTRCQRLLGDPVDIAWRVKQVVFDASGLTCSVGLSGDKTTAKWAAKQDKPNGFTVVHPSEAGAVLRDVPVQALCGINKGVGKFLEARGVRVCGEMSRLPIGVLGKRFGPLGRRIWLMAQGLDPARVVTTVAAPKSIGHGKVMPPNTRDWHTISIYLQHMCQKVGARLRRHHLEASHFLFGLRTRDNESGWVGDKVRGVMTQDGAVIYQLGLNMLVQQWQGASVWQIQVSALDPQPQQVQRDLFVEVDARRMLLNNVMDEVNACYGEFALAPAPLLERSVMPNVISPAWKPGGARDAISQGNGKKM